MSGITVDCEDGEFMREVAHDTKRNATTLDAEPASDPWKEAACLMSEMAAVLSYVHDYAPLDETAKFMVAHRLEAYELWKKRRVKK